MERSSSPCVPRAEHGALQAASSKAQEVAQGGASPRLAQTIGAARTSIGALATTSSASMGAARSLTSAAVDETKSIGPQLPSALSLRPRRRSAR
eukprot:COSAG04_NODE_2305_length_4360_cov_18.071579_6_plen_94_part_00